MRVHVVGAGLAGLSSAIRLAERGVAVTLHEAGPHCGGRCRSYHDRTLDTRIDNGNHLLLSGNDDTFAFLRAIGTAGTLAGPGRPLFPFIDVATGERWSLRFGRGRIPWWLARPRTRVPGTRLRDYLAIGRLLRANPGTTVREIVGTGALASRLLDPLSIAILNTMPERGSASLLAAVFRASLLRGGHACIPAFPRVGLSETFVDPALALLRARGATLLTASRISRLEVTDGRVAALLGPDRTHAVGADDAVVLAVPAPVATSLLPGLATPDRFEQILNVHFLTEPRTDVADVRDARFVGLAGGSFAEWVFLKDGVVSVTVSAASRFDALDNEAVASRAWAEVTRALGHAGVAEMPNWRVVREKRATFEATPASDGRRARADDARRGRGVANLALAGDWTATGLPATIEGAIKSGRTAAEVILAAA